MPMTKVTLYDYQLNAVKQMKNGCILCGGVGSGKSRTSLAYYYTKQGGTIKSRELLPSPPFYPYDAFKLYSVSFSSLPKKPKDLYIITTARKRDTLEWDEELLPFKLSPHSEVSLYEHRIVIDSWNNIKKYSEVSEAFFIFDEQRVVGSGVWVKSFLRIAKHNHWILLSATPGDTWLDYIPVFIANGFYKNRTEFKREHVIYSQFSKYPKVDRYINTGRLIRLRNNLLIDMVFKRQTTPHHEDIYTQYDISKYRDVGRLRWNPYKNEPIMNASELCYIWRRIVNSDESRQVALLELFEKHPRMIVFYNYDYELDILKNLYYGDDVMVAEWNGHKHQPIPETDSWVYLVQYTAGAEGWNCVKTDTIVFYSQNYSYKVMQQAAGRIDRLNTRYIDLYYYHLKSHSGIDLAISKALREKRVFNETKFLKKDANT